MSTRYLGSARSDIDSSIAGMCIAAFMIKLQEATENTIATTLIPTVSNIFSAPVC
ncbi:hypothetical protein GR197_23385 [Rhizobium phaseoli]|uniref:Uncharacterized protein n=1 Tax=Rhizobium phaseoli TaxID=396 RepID=A0A7K3UIC8_9HYPH|nr:hypothetical protein [Rhizobium phaseoli]NEJ73447.1 hypothetical protein [Rhizobium phaseoli]